MTFLRKLSSSVAVFGISYILELSGYVSTTGGEAAVQPESAVLAIRLTTALGPVLFLTFGILSALKFPINPGNYSRLKRYLDVKNGRSDDPVSPEEAKAIAAGLREITGKDIGTGGTP
jgi:oligogalacturonide transporter